VTITDAKLADYTALCEKATAGPWGPEAIEVWTTLDDSNDENDCAFIAAARTGWPETIAEVRRLRGFRMSKEDAHAIAQGFVQSRDWLTFHGEEPEQRLIDELADELCGGADTLAERDLREDQVQAIDVALGGTGEWSNNYDCGVEALKHIAELQAKVAGRDETIERLMNAWPAGYKFPKGLMEKEPTE